MKNKPIILKVFESIIQSLPDPLFCLEVSLVFHVSVMYKENVKSGLMCLHVLVDDCMAYGALNITTLFLMCPSKTFSVSKEAICCHLLSFCVCMLQI